MNDRDRLGLGVTALGIAAVLVGCKATIPKADGFFKCTDGKCPQGWYCHPEQLCHTWPLGQVEAPDAAGIPPVTGTGGTSGGSSTGGTTASTGGTTGSTGGTTGSTGGTTGSTGGTGGTAGGAGSSAGGGKAVANIMGFMGGTVTGTATFMQTGTDVSVTIMINNCPMGGAPVHIHQGTSCADAMTQGAHWDMTRGEGIPNIACNGMTGTLTGSTTATRMPTDPTLAWTVGGPMTTNVVGHVVVVHQLSTDGGAPPRIGCGVIMMQ
jgi:Cu/Zn superoxide dismutase